ncbi:hypothetical protein APHAL10511_007719 [Amanita phalloides]|nr:hypothetical protein APHAL10511_007719 [Amanita phalloides]
MSCDNPAATEKDDIMLRRPKFDKSKNCVKCKDHRGNVVIRHAVFCKACFFPFVTAKFKRALDPFINEKADISRRKVLRASGNLLLGFSGGVGSTILLDVISQHYISPATETVSGNPKGGKDHPRNDQVWKKVYVCYVETCNAFPENARDGTEDIRKVVQQYENVEFIPLHIENAFDNGWWLGHGGSAEFSDIALDMSDEGLSLASESRVRSLSPSEALRLYLSHLPTQTAIATTIQAFIRRLLLQTAYTTQSSHVLLGTSLTSLAIAHISSIAQGGGFAVKEEAQEEWNPTSTTIPEAREGRSIKVIRPLRDVGMKECGAWVWWRGLRVVGSKGYPGTKQEISALTRDFIVGLEADYPSTVSTIARTCAKVEPKEKSEMVCVMCERPAQRDIEGWKSRISIRDYPDLPDPSRVKELRPSSCIPEQALDIRPETLTGHLCYLCHTTLVSKSSRGVPFISGASERTDGLVALPVWVNARLQAHPGDDPTTAIAVKMDQKDMITALKGFLLTDE